MTIKEIRNNYQLELGGIYQKEEIFSFFHLLSEAYLDKTRIDIALEPNLKVTSVQLASFKSAIDLLKKEYPIQYILGSTEFMGLNFVVNKHVLIPRPETEELINWILKLNPKDTHYKVLDIGTGSGCIPIMLSKNLLNATVETMDVSAKALEVARKNALNHNASIKFFQDDILQVDSLPNTYDIIVSNPPYVRESEKAQMHNNVLKYEPDVALFVSDEAPLIFYKQIARLALKALHSKGSLFFEINQYLGKEVCEILNNLGFQHIELRKDMLGVDRMIRANKN